MDLTPEDLFTHGAVKTEIVAVLHGLTRRRIPGHVFTDSTRIASVPGDVSAEPDVVFLSEESAGTAPSPSRARASAAANLTPREGASCRSAPSPSSRSG